MTLRCWILTRSFNQSRCSSYTRARGEDVVALGFPLRVLLATDLHVSQGIVSATAGI
jgi:hypothetical protein